MKYNIITYAGIQEVNGRAFHQKMLPMKLFIHKTFLDSYVVTDVKTGAMVIDGLNKKEAIKRFYVYAECLRVFFGKELKSVIKQGQGKYKQINKL